MATELGQAYVQIMPSAKGISGSIQKAINPEATVAGKSAGRNIASSIADSMGKAGGTLTKAITLPVAGAMTAIGALVGALGFKRLVGLDTAQAKLRGLGYEAEEVERISSQVETAIAGGMTTMGEGVSIAAGGLAAGVKEGAALEKYIKLVGDAAVGANRPVDEMAQIFNRVQGGGRLMTQELNMIEMGLPGFAQAMADEVAGGSLEAFRGMVTNGEVGSEEFLNVMDDFAGGMAGAYSESWSGMAKNTLAYVGIIGEALLEGLFEDGKKGLANFIEVLQSDAVMDWATEAGEKIREVANTIVDFAKDAIQWWSGLSASTKQLIGSLAGVAVVLGPILLIASKMISTIMSLTPLFKVLGIVIGAITSPIGLVVTAIVAAAALIYVYWEPIKDFFINLWESIKDITLSVWETISEFFLEIWETISQIFMVVWEPIQEVWQVVSEFFAEIWMALVEFFTELWEDIKETMLEVWEPIQEMWGEVVEFFTEIWTGVAEFLSEIWSVMVEVIVEAWNAIVEFITPTLEFISEIISSVWQSIQIVISTVMDIIKNVIQTAWDIIKTVIQTVVNVIKTVIQTVWNVIKGIIQLVMSAIQGDISGVWNAIKSIISSVMSGISSVISSIWNGIKGVISSVLNGIKNTVSNIFNGLKGIVSGAFNGVKNAVTNGMKNALGAVTNVVGKFKDAGKKIVTSIADGIKGAIGKVTDAIGNVVGKVRDFLPFSPPKTGPLIDIMDVEWGETIGGGIEKGEGAVSKAMEEVLDFDLTKKARFNNPNASNSDDSTSSREKQPIIMQVDGKTFAKIMGDYNSEEGGNRIRKFERGLA